MAILCVNRRARIRTTLLSRKTKSIQARLNLILSALLSFTELPFLPVKPNLSCFRIDVCPLHGSSGRWHPVSNATKLPSRRLSGCHKPFRFQEFSFSCGRGLPVRGHTPFFCSFFGSSDAPVSYTHLT